MFLHSLASRPLRRWALAVVCALVAAAVQVICLSPGRQAARGLPEAGQPTGES